MAAKIAKAIRVPKDSWAVSFFRTKNTSNGITFTCFAYHNKIRYPPYPGHEVLERYLDKHHPSATYTRIISGDVPGESYSMLEVFFPDKEEAFIFRLTKS